MIFEGEELSTAFIAVVVTGGTSDATCARPGVRSADLAANQPAGRGLRCRSVVSSACYRVPHCSSPGRGRRTCPSALWNTSQADRLTGGNIYETIDQARAGRREFERRRDNHDLVSY